MLIQESYLLPFLIIKKDNYDSNLENFTAGTIEDQYVFALDGKEAKQYASKFKWERDQYYKYGFWTTAGFYFSNTATPRSLTISNDGNFSGSNDSTSLFIGARPVFWISLD